MAKPWSSINHKICGFCKTRPATLHFGDMLSFTHGGGLNCCEICSTEKQLAHARERAAAIPALEQKLARLHEGHPRVANSEPIE